MISVGYPRIGFRKVRVALDGFLEVRNRLPVAFRRKLVPEEPPPQIGFVCLSVEWMRFRTATVSRTELYFDLFRYRLGYLFLQFNRVTDVPVVAMCPHMHLVINPDELHADPYLVPIATDAAFEDIADAQFASNLFHALRAMLVGHRRGASDYAKLVGA